MGLEDIWEEFGVKIGPFGFGFHGIGGKVRYSRTESSHLLRIRIDPEIRKEEIKARLIRPGLLEVEWPRRFKGREIQVE